MRSGASLLITHTNAHSVAERRRREHRALTRLRPLGTSPINLTNIATSAHWRRCPPVDQAPGVPPRAQSAELLDSFLAPGSASRADLARLTGLSRSTVSRSSRLQASACPRPRSPPTGAAPQAVRHLLRSTLGRLVRVHRFGHDQSRRDRRPFAHHPPSARRRSTSPIPPPARSSRGQLADAVIGAAGVDARLLGAGVGLSGPIDMSRARSTRQDPPGLGRRAARDYLRAARVPVPSTTTQPGALAEWSSCGIGARDATYLMVSGGVGPASSSAASSIAAPAHRRRARHVLVDETPALRCGNRAALR